MTYVSSWDTKQADTNPLPRLHSFPRRLQALLLPLHLRKRSVALQRFALWTSRWRGSLHQYPSASLSNQDLPAIFGLQAEENIGPFFFYCWLRARMRGSSVYMPMKLSFGSQHKEHTAQKWPRHLRIVAVPHVCPLQSVVPFDNWWKEDARQRGQGWDDPQNSEGSLIVFQIKQFSLTNTRQLYILQDWWCFKTINYGFSNAFFCAFFSRISWEVKIDSTLADLLSEQY